MEKSDNRGLKKNLRFAVLASDVVLFSINEESLCVRLISVNRPPYFINKPGLPGGLIHPQETAEESTRRYLKEKTGISPQKAYMEQLYTFSAVDRDPRGRVVAVAYMALVPWNALSGSEKYKNEYSWWSVADKTHALAYDHDKILELALNRLRSRIRYTTLISKLMPEEFTLTELEKAYESILKTDLDKRNFRKKISKLGILKELPRKRAGGRSRPAKLYKFSKNKVSEVEVL